MSTEQAPIKTYKETIMDYWKSIDWTKTDMDIAGQTGTSYVSVKGWRQRVSDIANPKIPGRYYNVDWESVDWTLNNSAIARELHLPFSLVRQARITLKKPFPTKDNVHRKVDPEALAAINWELSKDVDISYKLGVTRERVRQLRHELNKPACVVSGTGPNMTECMLWLLKNKESLNGQSRRDIAKQFNAIHKGLLSRPQIYSAIRRAGLYITLEKESHADKISIYNNLNYDLPNIVLRMIYGVPSYRFGTNRNRLMKQKPKWFVGGFSKVIFDQEFLDAINAETEKAKAAGFTVNEARLKEWMDWKSQYKHPFTEAKENQQ